MRACVCVYFFSRGPFSSCVPRGFYVFTTWHRMCSGCRNMLRPKAFRQTATCLSQHQTPLQYHTHNNNNTEPACARAERLPPPPSELCTVIDLFSKHQGKQQYSPPAFFSRLVPTPPPTDSRPRPAETWRSSARERRSDPTARGGTRGTWRRSSGAGT